MQTVVIPGTTSATHVQTMVPDMSIVLVCWNNKKYLEPCLESLYNGGLRSTFDVIVVDNGSTDGSQEMLRAKFPQVQLIQNSQNVGLGKASNQGIEATHGRYVLLLNNDTIVNGPSLDVLVEFLDDHPSAGGAGGRLLNGDGTVQSCYNNFSTLVEEFLIATRLGEIFLSPGYPSTVVGDEVRQVDWLSSACLLLRRAALDQVGLLDESYFIYGDETDLQYRLKRAGWMIWYIPDSTIIHFGGRSMDRWRRRKMVYRGKILFYKKNYGAAQTTALRALLGVLSAFKILWWAPVAFFPAWRERAQKELKSNVEVVRLCYHLE